MRASGTRASATSSAAAAGASHPGRPPVAAVTGGAGSAGATGSRGRAICSRSARHERQRRGDPAQRRDGGGEEAEERQHDPLTPRRGFAFPNKDLIILD